MPEVRQFILVMALMVGPLSAGDVPRLGDKVLAFCKDHLDKTVSNGECAGLATQALKTVGAKPRAGPDWPGKGDYVWGKQVYLVEATPDGLKERGKLGNVRPGDIMQYRDVKLGERGGFSHHTAIVAEIDEEAKRIKVYQQNAGGRRFVTEGNLRLNRMVAGWIRIYRPIPQRRYRL
jgi:hypothetical protein